MNLVDQAGEGVTFRVSDVELATTALPTEKTNKHISRRLTRPPEVCSNYTSNLLRDVSTHPFLAAAKLAFDQHRPLILSPDMVWLTILQGVAEHLYAGECQNPEADPEKRAAPGLSPKPLIVSTEKFPYGSPESPWDEIISDASRQARTHVSKELQKLFSVAFTTTTHVEQATFDLTLLQGLDRFLTVYDALAICGFPSVTLEGTADDWLLIDDSVSIIAELGLSRWAEKLRKITFAFLEAILGKIDLDFWEQMIYMREGGICKKSVVINGWISDLFPYGARFGNLAQPRQLDGTDETDIVDFPSGLGKVKMISQRGSLAEIHAGFLGVSQQEDLSLRPELGWAVLRQTSFEQLMDEISCHPRCQWSVALPGPKPRQLSGPVTINDLREGDKILQVLCSRQLQQFYSLYHDLTIVSSEGTPLLRILPADELSEKRSGKLASPLLRIGILADGRILGLEDAFDDDLTNSLTAFFLADEDIAFERGPCNLISNNFEQVLRWALDAGDQLLDHAPGFRPIATIPPEQDQILRVLKPLGRID